MTLTRLYIRGDGSAYWIDATPELVLEAVRRGRAAHTDFIELVTTPFSSGDCHSIYVDPIEVVAITALEESDIHAAVEEDD